MTFNIFDKSANFPAGKTFEEGCYSQGCIAQTAYKQLYNSDRTVLLWQWVSKLMLRWITGLWKEWNGL